MEALLGLRGRSGPSEDNIVKLLSIQRTVAVCAIVTFLAGCGGSGSQSQIGASGAVPSAPMVVRPDSGNLVTITVVSRKRTLPNVLVDLILCPTLRWITCVGVGGNGKVVAHGKTNADGNADLVVTINPKRKYCAEANWKGEVVDDCGPVPFPNKYTVHMYPI
jgi:hypothetical protein